MKGPALLARGLKRDRTLPGPGPVSQTRTGTGQNSRKAAKTSLPAGMVPFFPVLGQNGKKRPKTAKPAGTLLLEGTNHLPPLGGGGLWRFY